MLVDLIFHVMGRGIGECVCASECRRTLARSRICRAYMWSREERVRIKMPKGRPWPRDVSFETESRAKQRGKIKNADQR